MELQHQVDILKQQLNIPKDKFQTIIYSIGKSFIKKYQNKVNRDPKEVTKDLKNVLRQLDIYSDYALQMMRKYNMFEKLQYIVKGIIENQSSLLTYIAEDMMNCLQQNAQINGQMSQMTRKVYQKCAACDKNIQKGRIDNLQAQISMRFKDLHSYFAHDIEQINKLEQEARLILHKKNLGLEGICQEVYIEKLIKMKDNMQSTIYYVNSSLDNIVSFQHKISELQQFHSYESKPSSIHNIQKFNAKNFMIKVSAHFQTQITKLQKKLAEIRKYFIIVHTQQTQTTISSQNFSSNRVDQLKQNLLQLQIQNKQLNIHKHSLQNKLSQSRVKCQALDDKVMKYQSQLDKYLFQIKNLQIELEIYRKKEDNTKTEHRQSTKQIIQNYLLAKKGQQRQQFDLANFNDNIQQQSNEDEDNKDDTNADQTKYNDNMLNPKQIQRKKSSMISKKKGTFDNTKTSTLLRRPSSSFNSIEKSNLVKSSEIKESDKQIQGNDDVYKKNQIKIIRKGNSFHSVISQNQQHKREMQKKQKNKHSIQIDLVVSDPNCESIKMPKIEQKQTNKKKKNNDKIQKMKLSKHQSEDDIQKLYKKYVLNNNPKISYDKFKKSFQSFVNELQNDKIVQKNQTKKKFAHKFMNQSQTINTFTNHSQKNKPLQNYDQSLNQYDQIISKDNNHYQNSLPQTLRKPDLCKNKKLNLQEISTKHLGTFQDGRANKRFSEDETGFLHHRKLGKTSIIPTRNRKSELYDNTMINFKQNMLKTSGFTKIQNQNIDLNQIFTKQDQQNVYLCNNNDNEPQIETKKISKKGKKLLNHKTYEALQPVQIRFTKQFFTRLANIHVNSQNSYKNIKQFMIKPYRQTCIPRLPGVHEKNLNRQDQNSSIMKQSLNSILINHRNCTVKGQICKHLNYFMKKIVKIEKNCSIDHS